MGILDRSRFGEKYGILGLGEGQPSDYFWRVGGNYKPGTETDWGSTTVSNKPTCATHGTGNNKCGTYPNCEPCDTETSTCNLITHKWVNGVCTPRSGGGECQSHEVWDPVSQSCVVKGSENCEHMPGYVWNGYKCVKDQREIETPVGTVFVGGTKYGMSDAKNIYDLDEKYFANYSGLRSGNNIFDTGPYGLEGPESSLLGFNQLGQPWGQNFIDRIGKIKPSDWSRTDEDEYVMATSGQDYLRYKIDPSCTTDCEETVVNLGHLTEEERVNFKRKADAGQLPGQVNPRTGRKTTSVGTSILDPVEEAVVEDASLLSAASSGRGGSGGGGGGEGRAPTTQTKNIKASKVKRDKTVKAVAKKANTTTKIASDAVSRARGDTALATRIAKMTKDFTAAKKKDPTVYMPTFRKGPSGGWLGGF